MPGKQKEIQDFCRFLPFLYLYKLALESVVFREIKNENSWLKLGMSPSGRDNEFIQ